MTYGHSSRPDPPAEPPTITPPEQEKVNGAIGGDGAATEAEAEAEVWGGRTHWKHYAGRLLVWLAANLIVAILVGWLAARVEWLAFRGAFWCVFGVLLVSGVLVVGRVVFIILGHRYRLTSQRLFIERGILSQTTDQTELIRVDDVRIHKSLFDRLFRLGTIAILTTDATDRQVVIEGITDPDKVGEAIRSRMRTMRRKSLFIENL